MIHAVRRAHDRPRLSDATSRVADHVTSRYSARIPRQEPQQEAPAPQETFQPHRQVEHAVAAAAAAFRTTAEKVLSGSRARVVTDARAVAVSAARTHGQSLPAIARTMDVHHTTVLSATRRIEKTPPLRDLAVKIARQLPTNDNVPTPAAETVATEPSAGARAQKRDIDPVRPAEPRHLRVAR